jgi:general secretion pathway protein G
LEDDRNTISLGRRSRDYIGWLAGTPPAAAASEASLAADRYPHCCSARLAARRRRVFPSDSWQGGFSMICAGRNRRGFSLVELVIVIIIIGIIAAIAVPRFSAATTNANDKQVKASLAILQNAVDLYQAEHTGTTTTKWNLGVAGSPTSVTAAKGLLKQTESTGALGDLSGNEFGPYVRSLPANLNKGEVFVGIEIDDGSTQTCTAGVAGDGLGQTWTNAQCGWTLKTTDLTISPKP